MCWTPEKVIIKLIHYYRIEQANEDIKKYTNHPELQSVLDKRKDVF